MVSPELIVGYKRWSVISDYLLRLKIQDFANGSIYSADIDRAVLGVCGFQTHSRTEDTGWVEPSIFCPFRLTTAQYGQGDHTPLFLEFSPPGIKPAHPFLSGSIERLSAAARLPLLSIL
jgi:hypothetical protein